MGTYDRFKYARIPPDKIITWITSNFEYKTRKSESEYLINSPFDGDTGYNFNINPDSGQCHDWRGNEWAGPPNPKSGKRNCSFIQFVKKYRNCDYHTAIKEVLGSVTNLAAYLRPENRITTIRDSIIELPRGSEKLSVATDKQAELLIKWLNSRGYSNDDIDKHDLYYNGMTVIWPYFEFESLVYWQSRSRLNKRFMFPDTHIYNDKGDIVARRDVSKSDYLYGFDDAQMSSFIIITEAIFDQHTLGDQALASGGAILTDKQIAKIRALNPRDGVILAPDNDKAGLNSVISNLKLLANFTIYYCVPPSIEYIKNGETKYSKDFNELFEKCHWSKHKIRSYFDNNIRKLTVVERNKLMDKINNLV